MTTGTILSAGTLTGDDVVNSDGDKLGTLKDVMIDFDRGTVAYGVLSRGGVAGIGEKLFAVPWALFDVDTDEKELTLDLDEERLEDSPGFDPDHWPTFADEAWGRELHEHYGVHPYWGSSRDEEASSSGL